jgi:hypothetical protein
MKQAQSKKPCHEYFPKMFGRTTRSAGKIPATNTNVKLKEKLKLYRNRLSGCAYIMQN